jgi:hypothetical protein
VVNGRADREDRSIRSNASQRHNLRAVSGRDRTQDVLAGRECLAGRFESERDVCLYHRALTVSHRSKNDRAGRKQCNAIRKRLHDLPPSRLVTQQIRAIGRPDQASAQIHENKSLYKPMAARMNRRVHAPVNA